MDTVGAGTASGGQARRRPDEWRSLRVAIAVHGRFVAFDLAQALRGRGHDVTLLTNYPRWAAHRFGVDGLPLRSFPLHGILARVVGGGRTTRLAGRRMEALLHGLFGRWVATRLAREPWDAVLCFSGVAEEALRRLAGSRVRRMVVRGSAHIRTQARLLEEEARRTGMPVHGPSPWMIAREEREYALADRIVVLSTFSRDTFVAEGVLPERLVLMPPGVRLDRFRATPEVVEARCRRIAAGQPLRVLNVGAFSLQKGMWDMAEAIERLGSRRFEFHFVGTVTPEARTLAGRLGRTAVFHGHRPEAALPEAYAWGDVFVLPTVHDGFGVVLLQAQAAALPVVTTPHGAGSDLVREGATGWLVPVRSAEAIVRRLRWCDENRPALVRMVRSLAAASPLWNGNWDRATTAFERACGMPV